MAVGRDGTSEKGLWQWKGMVPLRRDNGNGKGWYL